MRTKHTTSHHLDSEPTDYTTWSHEALLARKRELKAKILQAYPMPATETDEDAYIDRLIQEHKHLFRSASPTAAAPTDDAEPVHGNELLQEITQFIARYLQCSEHQLTLLALWVLHTYCFGAARVTPYLAIRSAEKQSGKTLCLQLLSLLCDHAALTSGGFTAHDLALPTKEKPIAALLFDECHLTIGTRAHPRSPALRAVLAGSFHLGLGHRNIAEERNAFLPKAFASRGPLPEELADRCIPIILEPLAAVSPKLDPVVGAPSTKACTEVQAEASSSSSPSSSSTPSISSTKIPERFDLHLVREESARLRDRLQRWTKNHFNLLTNRTLLPRSAFPPNLSPRQQDLCDPLLQIAALVGGPWIARTLEACAVVFDLQSLFDLRPNLQLLADVRDCFAHHNWPGRLPTELLQDWTDSLPPRPWDADGPLNARTIAHLLRPFHIHPRELRTESNKFRRGYELQDFKEPWKKYFPHSTIVNKDKGCDTIANDAGAGPRASESRTTRTEQRPLGRIRKVNACHPARPGVPWERSASKTPHPTTFLSAESTCPGVPWKDPENVGSDDGDSGSSPQYVASKNAAHRRTTRTGKKKLASVIPHHRPLLHETSVHVPMEKEATVSPNRKGDLPNLVRPGASSQKLAAQTSQIPNKKAVCDTTSSAEGSQGLANRRSAVADDTISAVDEVRQRSAVADDTKKSAASTDQSTCPGAPWKVIAQQPRPNEILPGITCGDVFDERFELAFRR